MLNSTDVENLRQQFQKIDTDNSGFIEANELEIALKKAEKEAHSKELHAILKELDYNGNDKINYTEFLAATISI
jgi:calcium-dependent protein kinase